MSDYLLIIQREIICKVSLQATNPEEAWKLAEATNKTLDSRAFSLVNTEMELYEAEISLTQEQLHGMIDELITCFGYENITERTVADRQQIIATYASERFQDEEYICVLYKEAVGPFYCSFSHQLVLKLMEERALHGISPRSDQSVLAGSVQDYDQLKTRKFQGKSHIAVVKRKDDRG